MKIYQCNWLHEILLTNILLLTFLHDYLNVLFIFFFLFSNRSPAMARHRRSRKNRFSRSQYILEHTILVSLCFYCVITLCLDIVNSEYTGMETITETFTDVFINDLDRPSKWHRFLYILPSFYSYFFFCSCCFLVAFHCKTDFFLVNRNQNLCCLFFWQA